MRFIKLFLALLCLQGLAVGVVRAGDAPVDSSRVLHVFDFEERQFGNDEDLPMHWKKIDSVDFPHYVTGRMTTDAHRSGTHSFRMDLDGGNCAYQYDPGRIPVQPGSRYRLDGYCRTTILAHARARLTLYLTDRDLHPLNDTVRHSALFVSEAADDDWHPLSAEITAGPGAAFLVAQMELLQPSQYSRAVPGSHAIFLQDIRGSAWFDDLVVAQIPEITLSTDRVGNMFGRNEPAVINAQVDDHAVEDLTVQLSVTDASGRRISQRTGDAAISGETSAGPGLRRLKLPLPETPPGWYRASLVTMSHGMLVGEQTLDWIRLAEDDTGTMPDARFGVNATEVPYSCWLELPEVLRSLAVGRVKLAVWSKEGDAGQIDPAQLDQMLDDLAQRGILTVGCLTGLPPRLGDRLNGGWLQMLSGREEDWQVPLSFMVSRLANHIQHWQLGIDGSTDFALNPDMRKVYTKVLAKYASLLDKPDLALPFPVTYEVPEPAPNALALSVPPEVIPSEIPIYLQEFRGRDSVNLSVTLTPLNTAAYGRNVQISDLTQRIVYSLAAGANHIDLPLPMQLRKQNENLAIEPMELALIERTLLSSLSGSTYRGQVPLADDISAFLFEKNGQGILVAWDKNDVQQARPLAVDLGERPMQRDLWGNTLPLLKADGSEGGDATGATARLPGTLIQLRVGRMPTIFTGVDSEMSQLRAAVSFDRPLIESTFQPHARHVRFYNPFSTPIGGTLKLHTPAGWTINPPTFNFTLNPGETFDHEVSVEIPFNGVAGKNRVNAEFDLQATRHSRFNVPINLMLGLTDVGTQSIAYRDGKDVVVQQMISNYGDQAIDYSAFAAFPGKPRIERLVTSLGPGKTVIKKYRFSDVKPTPGMKIRVGLKETDGARILNDEVELK